MLEIQPLLNPMDADDNADMLPIDFAAVRNKKGEPYEDVDDMAELLGPAGSVEAFIKAREYFVENKGGEPEEGRATTIKGKELKAMMKQDMEDNEAVSAENSK